jgi:hypothetical protein
MIEIEVLNAILGDKTSIKIEDNDPEKRPELARHVLELQKQGVLVLIEHEGKTYRIKSYDADANEWVVVLPRMLRKAGEKRIPAHDTKPVSVSMASGG